MCEEHYRQYTTRDSTGRYIVKLPFRQDPRTIGDTGYTTMHQFNSLKRRRWKEPQRWEQYCNYMANFIKAGYATRIAPVPNPPPIIYLPHHAVVKESSSTTKLWVVFDGSQRSSNGSTLNELLITGPVVQETLYHILLNFRTHRVALTGDIEKMYLQIRVTEEDSKLVRMLWQEPGQPVAEYG